MVKPANKAPFEHDQHQRRKDQPEHLALLKYPIKVSFPHVAHDWHLLWPGSSDIEPKDRKQNERQEGSKHHGFHLRLSHSLRFERISWLQKEVQDVVCDSDVRATSPAGAESSVHLLKGHHLVDRYIGEDGAASPESFAQFRFRQHRVFHLLQHQDCAHVVGAIRWKREFNDRSLSQFAVPGWQIERDKAVCCLPGSDHGCL